MVTREEIERRLMKSLETWPSSLRPGCSSVIGSWKSLPDSKSELTPLPVWSGTDAVLGSLDLAIAAMEGTLRNFDKSKSRWGMP